MIPLDIVSDVLGFGILGGCVGGVAYGGYRVKRGWNSRRRRKKYQRLVRRGGYVVPLFCYRRNNEQVAKEDVFGVDSTGSIGIIGTTQSGKTQMGYLLAYQMLDEWGTESPMIVYERKDDWKDFLPDDSIIISGRGSTHVWNLFDEIEREEDIDAMSRLLFPRAEGDSFFVTASRQLFTAVCKYLRREYAKEGRTPTNQSLVNFFESTPREDMYEALSEYDDHQHPFIAAKSSIDPDASEQSVGVYSNVQQEIKDIFVGDFRRAPEERESFSFSGYFRDPDVPVILDHPTKMGDSVNRLYRYFIDSSAQYGIDTGGGTYIFDEFARIPYLRNVGELANVGAGEDVKMLGILQSKRQLDDRYGEAQAESILSGFPNQIFLKLNDEASIQYAREIIGTEKVEYEEPKYDETTGDSIGTRTRKREEHPFARGDFTKFQPGDCVIKNRNGEWAFGRFEMLEECKEKIDWVYENA